MIAFQGYELEHDGLCWILRQMREKPSEKTGKVGIRQVTYHGSVAQSAPRKSELRAKVSG